MPLFKKSNSPIEQIGLLFLHIPKTAGTSFRVAAGKSEWGLKVYSDYGDQSITSRVIRQCYKKKDFSAIKSISYKKTILAGHYNLRRYARYYSVDNVISFVREPVQRILSHYHHMIRNDRYQGSLESFIKNPRYRNIQSRTFNHCPVEAIGFIGLTEKYNESLELINRIYSLKIRTKFINKNSKKLTESYTADQELIDLIKAHNQDDVKLYEKVQRIFLAKERVVQEKIDYVFGKVDVINEYNICGWAINPKIQAPVNVDIFINGQQVATLAADLPRKDFKRLIVHRKSDVGFEYVSAMKIVPSDRIVVRVADTNQLISDQFEYDGAVNSDDRMVRSASQ